MSRGRPEVGFTRSYLVKSPPRVRPSSMQPAAADSTRGGLLGNGAPALRETLCHGLLRDPKLGGSGAKPRVEMPDPLIFHSWWNEEVAMPVELTPSGQGHGVRRQVSLHYLPSHGSFQLFTEDVQAALTLMIEHADGTPVGPHELYVGATLDVLGRPMTLRSASARTISWIDSEAKRLLRRREGLCAQISKFQDVHKALERAGISQLYLNRQMTPDTQTAVPAGGKANLHRLYAEVAALEAILVRYRS